MFIKFENTVTPKKAFYSMASRAELTDIYAKARFEAEPWHLTDMKIRKGVQNESDGSTGIEAEDTGII